MQRRASFLFENVPVFFLNNILSSFQKEENTPGVLVLEDGNRLSFPSKRNLICDSIKLKSSVNYCCNAAEIVANIIGLIYCGALIMFQFRDSRNSQLSNVRRIVCSLIMAPPIIMNDGVPRPKSFNRMKSEDPAEEGI
jgi:hypothetical protein